MKKIKRARRSSVKPTVTAPPPAPQKKSPRSSMVRYATYGLAILAALGVRYWLKGPDIPAPPPDKLDTRLAEEVEDLRAAIWEAPRQPERWGDMGMLLAAHLFPKEAVRCFDRASQLDPDDWSWIYLRSIAYEPSDPAAALDALREAAVAAGDGEPLPRLLLVERLLETGQFDEGRRQLDIALRYWPDHPRANLCQARYLFLRDDITGAMTALQRSLKDRHTRRAAHQLLAQLQRRQGDQKSADGTLAVLKSLPRDEPWPDPWREQLESFHMRKGAFIARINELNQRGEIEKLKRLVAKSIERYPELAHLIAGRQRLAGGDLPEAERILRDAARLDPHSIDALLSLAEAFERQNKFDDAESVLRNAVQIEPSNGGAYIRLGRCYLTQGDHAAAIVPLRTAVHLMPSSSDAHSALADALTAAGQKEEADEHRRLAERLSAATPAEILAPAGTIAPAKTTAPAGRPGLAPPQSVPQRPPN